MSIVYLICAKVYYSAEHEQTVSHNDTKPGYR